MYCFIIVVEHWASESLSDETRLAEAIIVELALAESCSYDSRGGGCLVLNVRGRVAEHSQHVLARGRVHRCVVGGGCGYGCGERTAVVALLGRHIRRRLPVRRCGLWSVLAIAIAIRGERRRRLVWLLGVLLREHRDIGAVLRALIFWRWQRRFFLFQNYGRLVTCNKSC